MIRNFKYFSFFFALMLSIQVQAGNTDRTGEAGAYELLMNPFARTMGMMGINSASVRGIEALGTNVSGLAFNKGLTVNASYLNWLSGTETSMYGVGVASELSAGNSLAFNINYLTYGKLQLTQTNTSEILGSFSPYMMNLGLTYARTFGRGVRGGITGKLINEGINNISGTGFSLDAGIQYTTGVNEDFHFGVYVRNLGFPIRYAGDGVTIKTRPYAGAQHDLSLFQRVAKFELPAQFSIGLSKDLYFGKTRAVESFCKPAHRMTMATNFVYNSFTPNTYGFGFEYAFKEALGLRAGYLYEQDAFDKDKTIRAHMGVSAGISYDIKMGNKAAKNPAVIEFAYNYRPTWVFKGTHNLGVTYFTSKYSYCDEYVIDRKVIEVAEVAKEAPKKEEKKEPEIKYITKYDTIFKTAPAKIETVVEYKKVNDILKSFAGNIEFKSGTAILTERGEGALMVIGDLMKQYPQSRFKIVGHTDNDGTPENNMRLSKLRARTVARYINEFKAIPENSMTVEWYGEERPIAPNDNDNGKQRNRRVEITVMDDNLESKSRTSTSTSSSSVTNTPPPTETAKAIVSKIKETTTNVVEEKATELVEVKKTPAEQLVEIAPTLTFKTGTDSLTRFSKRSITKVAVLMKENQNLKIAMDVHTDNSNYGIPNLDLSKNRAKSLIEALKAEGVDAARISADGLGDTKPIDSNDSELGKSKNRRIEIRVVN